MALLNRNNFIVWGYQPPEPEHLVDLPGGMPPGRMSAAVLMVPNEPLTFYLNAPNGLEINGANIALVNDRFQTVHANVGSLTTIPNPGTANPQYYALVMPPPGLQMDYYRLAINPGTTYFSNRLWYKPKDYQYTSALFSFRSERDVCDIPFTLPELSAFRQNLRLKVSAGVSQNDTKTGEYTNVFSGRKRTTDVQQNMFNTFNAVNIDAIGREGFAAMFAHSDIKINNRPYTVKTGFQTATDTAYIANGTFDMWDQSFAMVRNC